MLAILPSVFTEADYDAGYRYEPSILQAEFSMAPGLDRPALGGCFSSRSSGATSNPVAPTGSASLSHGQDYCPSLTGRPDPYRSRLPYRVVVSARLFYARQ